MNSEHQEQFERAIAMATAKYPDESIMLLNEGWLRERAETIRSHFAGTTAYAVKANPRRRILRILSEAGIHTFDCASPDEVKKVLRVNPEARIMYNMPINTRTDIAEILSLGGRHFTVQDREGVEEILTCALLATRPADINPENLHIVARLETSNPDAGIDLSEKFGATTDEVREIIDDIRRAGATPGMSIHTGSQNTDPKQFGKGIRKMTKLARELGGVHSINIGGGLPANIQETDNYAVEGFLDEINYSVRRNINGVFAADCESSPEDCTFIEPGRAMVAEAVTLIIPVLRVTRRHGEGVVYMKEGLFGCFFDAALHNWQFPFQARSKDNQPLSGKKAVYRLFGQTCDSGDKIERILLPENIKKGDILRVDAAGAYMSSQASNFNGCKTARYVSFNKK